MLNKYGSFEVLTAEMAHGGSRGLRRALAKAGCAPGSEHTYRKVAHRAEFEYEARPGFLYVRSRAISSRCNDNFDEFPAEEIKKAYGTFVGKPVFVNHHNQNHRRARGVIIAAALHEDVNPDGSPDTWVEVLMEVDAKNFPKLAKAILAGEIDRTSMGTDVAFSVCSACGNKAATPLDYCVHIPKMKGQTYYPRTASGGRGQGEVIREICYGLGFFENSLLVEPPADPTAHFLGVEAGPGIEVTASRRTAGFGVSDDIDAWFSPFISEELDPERLIYDWARGFEESMSYGPGYNRGVNDYVTDARQSFQRGDLEGARDSLRRAGDWLARRTAAVEPPSRLGKRYWCQSENSTGNRWSHDSGDGTPSRKRCSYCGGSFIVQEGLYGVFEWEEQNRYDTADAKGWYTKREKAEAENPDLVARWKDARELGRSTAKTASDHGCTVVVGPEGEQCGKPSVSEWTSSRGETYYECEDHAVTPSSAPPPGSLAVGDKVRVTHVGVPKSGEITWMGSSNCKVRVPIYEGTDRATTKEITVPQSEVTKTASKTAALRPVVAFGEQIAPSKVDTLRDETCPICGEKDSYNGDQCMVCEFIRPPEQFMDPDLTKAQQVDLRQSQDDKAGVNQGVKCDSCGKTFGGGTKVQAAASPSKFSLPKPSSSPEDEAHEPQAGDTCPSCGEGTLQAISTTPDAEAELLDAFEPPDDAQPDAQGDEDEADGTDDSNGEGDSDEKPLTDEDDGEDEGGGKKPFPPKKSVRRPVAVAHDEGVDVDMRPILAATLQQQHMARANRAALERIASLAGVDLSDIYAVADRHVAALEPHVAGLRRQADEANPAQPIPSPPAEAPAATTSEQLQGLNADSVTEPGATSKTDVSPDATTSLDGTGTTLDTPLDLNEQDVTKPVAGTEGPRPIEEVRIETDVRAGTPARNDTMWPMEGPFAEQPKVSQRSVDPRTIQAMRLASLRTAAGTARGDQIAIATQIVASDMTNEMIQHEIRTLTPVVANMGAPAPAQAPPQPVATRTMPSLAPTTASAPPVGGEVQMDDTALFEG